jgi:hypothetical protein
MQPGAHPDDIHSILNRFTAWTGRQPANGNGHRTDLGEGVREVSYDDAMRDLRSRRAPHTPRLPAIAAPPPQPEPPPERPLPVAQSARDERPQESAPSCPPHAAVVRKPARRKTPAALEARPSAGKPSARKAKAPSPVEFREVLARTVNPKARALPKPSKHPERTQRVSVRLSAAEERRLQQCAAGAGVSVSEYLRMRALPQEPPRAHAGALPAAVGHGQPASCQPVPSPSRSTFGDWIALLRHRFLASPQRFAERA